jgi:uncharacterized protein
MHSVPALPRIPSKNPVPLRNSTDKSKSSQRSNPGIGFLGEKEKPEFLSLLETVAPIDRPQTREINELWRDLPALERELIETKSLDALGRYKEQVRSLLQLILAKNTKITKQFTPIRGSALKKEYSHVDILDAKLKILAETISHPQNSAFQILKQMDSIKGILLDIER